MLRCKTMYSNNPRRLETLDILDENGRKIVTAVKSRCNEIECESFYSYREGKRHLERKMERKRNVVREYIFPKSAKGKTKITETYYRGGHEVYTCSLNEKCEPLFTYWHDTKEVVIA